MTGPLVVESGELSADEVLSALDDGRSVVVRVEFAGATHEVTLRFDGNTYYCDTPTRLHRHTDEAEMRGCIENDGYASDGTTESEPTADDADAV